MVTQASWDDVWLSEGFATWFSAKVMDEEQPATRQHLAAVGLRERIMGVDASPRTRPVRLAMHSREDTKTVYARIVYDKGAAILLMLDGWLGEDRVQAGLRAYLKAHRFENATTADLESALRTAAGVDPAPVMDSFLNQTGIPEIHGEARCDQGAPKMEIEQTNTEHQWNVPVCWRADGTGTTCAVLNSEHREVALKSCPAWIYLNAGGNGYYRTAWTAPQLSALDMTKLTAAERLTLVGDLKALKSSVDVSAALTRLATDVEPEIAKAASDALK
jgi:alanyl aminopeptidase